MVTSTTTALCIGIPAVCGISGIFLHKKKWIFHSPFDRYGFNSSWFIMDDGINYHWEYTFIVGAICLITAAIVAVKVKEKTVASDT